MELLKIRNLNISFLQYTSLFKKEKLTVIRDMNLTINSGEIVAVIGASGSGKSVLAHSILGLLPYNGQCEGDIIFNGKTLSQKDKEGLRGEEIVLVPQSVEYLDPLMKIGPQIVSENPTKEKEEKMQSILNRYGLPQDTSQKYPFELSGGMIRRTLISTAVMKNSSLIIADEPTPGLHLEVAKKVMGHFKELAQNGAGVLLITHDLELALTVADKVMVLYSGSAIELANNEDFQKISTLRHPYTKSLWKSMPKNGFNLISGSQPYAKDVTIGCPYIKSCNKKTENCKKSIPWNEFHGGFVRCINVESGEEDET